MESPTRRETPLLESYSYQSTSTPITNINRTCSGITVDSEHNATFLSDYSNDIGQSRLCIKEIETPDTLPGYPGLGADDLKGTPHSTTSVDSGHHYHFSSQNIDDSKHPFTISSGMRPTSSNAPGFAASSIIRLINKDMTQQFHGRAPANSSSGAKIDWFGNRKAQVLGLCSTFAFLAIAIALSSYRWIGLIVGSINTICCGSAVVATYFRKKQWHQHPNPIIRNRAILGIFLAICLLLNVWLDYSVGSAHNEHCQRLAGMTEFFFFTSEAWGLVMACDLYFSLNSPFTSYKRMMRFYHLWVWLGGVLVGGMTWTIRGAGGFFTVDGQSLKYGSSLSTVVGFCMASSRICCPEGHFCGGDHHATCGDGATFLTTQKWPWVLIYSFVIVVLIASVWVLMLAWHRLYLRGVPKTYNIRLRVLSYISFFTGACVFYWFLLLLVYMSAYFTATRSTQTPNLVQLAQVFRQIMAFLIASKGYLDYVIWFAINNTKTTHSPYRTHDSSNADCGLSNGRNRFAETAEVEVDLSPQVNMALRSEILYYTTSGIKASIQSCKDEEIQIPIFGENEKKLVKFWSFCPLSFRNIRKSFGITDHDYLRMFGATTKEQFSEGRSGAFMFFTGDEQLIVKTMSHEECSFLRKIAPQYEHYVTQNNDTLMTRFYGCHAVSLYGNVYYFVVMGNIFAEAQVIHHRYDIKGSWVDRNAKVPKTGDKTTCRYCNASYTFGFKKNQECGDGVHFHEPNIVLKDNDLMTKIRINLTQANRIYDQIIQDSDFLCEQGIMDYSVLMGVQSCEYYVDSNQENNPKLSVKQGSIHSHEATSVTGPSLYHFGIIDILQQWTLQKQFERFCKCQIKRKDPDGVSAMPPKSYKFRFQQRMSRIFALERLQVAPTFHRHHPALVEIIDQSEFSATRLGATMGMSCGIAE